MYDLCMDDVAGTFLFVVLSSKCKLFGFPFSSTTYFLQFSSSINAMFINILTTDLNWGFEMGDCVKKNI